MPVRSKPARWALTPGAVDPRFRKFWRDPAFVLSPWHWDLAYDLANRDPASQQPASSVGAFGRGWDCLDLGDDSYVIHWPTSSANTHIAGPLEWTMFFAYDYDATPGFNVGYAVRRNVEWNNGGYAARIADNDLEFHFHSQTDGQAQNIWMNAYSRELGYNSFIVTRHSDGRVRAYVNGEDLGDPTAEDIAPDELVEPHSGTGNFRVNTSTEINGRMLTAWISRGVSVHRREAAAMHNDPWAIFRPRT